MPDALIGPNAIIHVAEAIRREFGPDQLMRVMRAARLGHLVNPPPAHMVSELDVASLHRAVAANVEPSQGVEIMAEAGHRTARYLLANRIPAPARLVLKALPAPLAARLLLKAIDKHAWTFAGSSTFRFDARHPVRISLAGSPMFATPQPRRLAASYFEATFETLFRELVSKRARAATSSPTANAEGADGNAAVCAFDLIWNS